MLSFTANGEDIHKGVSGYFLIFDGNQWYGIKKLNPNDVFPNYKIVLKIPVIYDTSRQEYLQDKLDIEDREIPNHIQVNNDYLN